MTLPSFEVARGCLFPAKPRIRVLEIRDRERPDGRAIAWLFVERQEEYRFSPDNRVEEATIRLSYARIMASSCHWLEGKGSFAASYASRAGEGWLSLTSGSATMPRGTVLVDLPALRGQRIGTYLMNEIVTWARQWPEAQVQPVQLLSSQGHLENRARRNRLYEQFGLVFDFDDADRRLGCSRPMVAGSLLPVESWRQNISEKTVSAYFREVLDLQEQFTAMPTPHASGRTGDARALSETAQSARAAWRALCARYVTWLR